MESVEGLPIEHVGLKVEPEKEKELPSASPELIASAVEMRKVPCAVEALTDPSTSINTADQPLSELPASAVETATPPPADPDALLMPKIDALRQQMISLNQEFQSKLKYDAHKEKIIDALHQELQEYKNDIIKKQMLSVFMDIIKIIDDIRKWMRHYRNQDSAARDPLKLFKYLESIPSDLEDLFYWQGVKSFTGESPTFDPARQRVSRKIETAVKEQDHTIAESLRPGYEWEGKIIRPEMVALYFYKDTPADIEERTADE